MNDYNKAVAAETIRLIGKGWKAENAVKRARKNCKHMHPQAKRVTARKLEAADTRFERTGDLNSYSAI